MRKTRIVRRFDRSSHEVGQAYADDLALFHAGFALPPGEYAPTGGAVPIRVRGSLVGVLAISGPASSDDHDLAIRALSRVASTARGDDPP